MDISALIEQLKDADEEVRADARDELTMQMDDDVAKAFLEIAKSNAPERVRADTIIGLGPVIDETGLYVAEQEEGIPVDDLEPEISRETFDLILRELRAIFEDESQPKIVRRSALEALVRHPQPWQEAAIRKLVDSNDPEWRLTGVFAMGYIPGFEQEIAGVLANAEGSLLYEAVRAAGRAEVAETAPRLRSIASDESADSGLRAAAIDSLPFVDTDCRELLEELADSDDEEVAEAAEAALDEMSMLDHEHDDEDE